MRPLALLALAGLVLPALAGCSEGEPDAETVSDGCGAELHNIPSTLAPGEPFTYRLDGACPDRDFLSPAASVRFAPAPVAAPTLAAYPDSCGEVTFRTGFPAEKPCAFADPGTYYVRGFIELPLADGSSRLMWSEEFLAVVGPAPAGPRAALLDVPSTVARNTPLTFAVRVTGVTATSDHVGAHWSLDSKAAQPPDTGLYAKPCDHVTDTVSLPGTHTATCTFDAPTAFIRAHARWSEGAETRNVWGPEVPLRLA